MNEDIQKRSNDVSELLKDAVREIPKIFENKIDNIKTNDIREILEDFRDKEAKNIIDVMSDTINIIESPIYVGFLGKYSHGKTALINSLFSIDEEYLLPEGEGQVTSKVTRIEFNNSVAFPKCFEVDKKDRRTSIEFSILRNSVSKNSGNEDNSSIAYYLMQLVSTTTFGKIFEEDNIALIDLPGLGGKYFQDTINTKRYVQNLDMLIVAINITDIENSAKNIEPYIRDLSIPIIPVFTFFDKWRDSNIFIKCSNDEEALSLAKEIVTDKFDSLKKYQTRIIATSAKTNFQIDTLREMILTFVDTENIAIEKIKGKDPIVLKQKISEISMAMKKVMNNTDKSLVLLNKKIENILPVSNRLQQFSEYISKKQTRELKKINKEIDSEIRDAFRDFKDNIYDIKDLIKTEAILVKVKNIEKEFNSLINEINKSIQDNYKSYRNLFSDFIDDYLNDLHIDKSTKEYIKEDLKSLVDDNEIDFQEIHYEAPSIQAIISKNTAKTFADKIKGNIFNPKFFIPLFLGLFLLTWRFKIFGFDAPDWISNVGLLMFIGSFIVVIYNYFTDETSRKNNFYNAKNDIIDRIKASSDQQEYKKRYKSIVDKASCELIGEIDGYLKSETSPYKKDLKIISQISKALRELLEYINKQLKRQV